MRVELGFRRDAEPQAVVANFRKFVGSRFSALRSRSPTGLPQKGVERKL